MKTARKIVSVIYALISLYICLLSIKSFIYAVSTISIDQNGVSVGIIGGADGPTFRFFIENFFKNILSLLFPLSAIGFNIFNLISEFSKRQISYILLLVWAALNLVLLLFMPLQSTVLVTYMLYRPTIDTGWMYLFIRCHTVTPKFIFSIVGQLDNFARIRYKKAP